MSSASCICILHEIIFFPKDFGKGTFEFDVLIQMDGFEEFESRRRKKFDKQIDSNVMMSSTALDEGLDRR